MGGDVGHARNLAAIVRRNVPRVELKGLHHGWIDRSGERTGELIADGHAVNHVGHLIVGPARMHRSVGVGGETGQGEQDPFQPTGSGLDGHLLDGSAVELGAGPGGLGIDQRHSLYQRDLNGLPLSRQRELDRDEDGKVGAKMDGLGVGGETGVAYLQLVGLERNVEDLEGAIRFSGGAALESGQEVGQANGGSGHGGSKRIDHGAAQLCRCLSPCRPGDSENQKDSQKDRIDHCLTLPRCDRGGRGLPWLEGCPGSTRETPAWDTPPQPPVLPEPPGQTPCSARLLAQAFASLK